jgi:hypothetical protein
MATTSTSKGTTAKKATAVREAPAPPTEQDETAKDRKVHLLIRRDTTSGAIVAIENFTGELAARRELDGRDPVWRYLGLRPGTPFEVEAVGTDG